MRDCLQAERCATGIAVPFARQWPSHRHDGATIYGQSAPTTHDQDRSPQARLDARRGIGPAGARPRARRRQGHAEGSGQPDARPQRAQGAASTGPTCWARRCSAMPGCLRQWPRPAGLGARRRPDRHARALPRRQLHPRADAHQAGRDSRLPAGLEPARRRAAAGPVLHVRRASTTSTMPRPITARPTIRNICRWR